MTKVWSEQEQLRAARKAILSAVGGHPPVELENGDITILLDTNSLKNHWGDVQWSISRAILKCYNADILDSNADWGRKILIKIPSAQKPKFFQDLGEIQRAHRTKDSIPSR